MSGRTTRTRLLAVTTLAVASLALTACGGGTSVAQDEGPATTSGAPAASATRSATTPPSDAPPTTSPVTAAPTSAPAPKPTAGRTGGTTKPKPTGTGTSTGAGGTGGSRHPACGAGNTRTTATPVSRPLNHLLLTVTNSGSALCDLVGFPIVRFGEAQSVPPVDESTKPQAVVTLAPGESGYAGVMLASADGSGGHGSTATSLTVLFGDDTASKPRLPAKGVYVDSSLRVTYWQHGLDDALN
ncbi:DUF4232 domain-containing protein [Streptomyces sp. NPDC002057]|uniref:DUF4232 domain-containing protein n=1 Tax=Streptomyces sp. NPDC002057 TaxID=3154664 RepID=UPI003325D77C